MLIHPVGREDEQAPGPRRDLETEIGKTCRATALDVVEIPQEHQIAIRQMIDGIEMQLESLTGRRAVTLQDEIGAGRRVGHGNAKPKSAL